MSEHVHVHAPHELTESHGEATTRSERILELVATLLLALATLGIAWSGYQGARWNGRQAREYAQSNAARNFANRAATTGAQNRTQDLLNFNRWLEVKTEGNQQLADLYQRRFRPEFLPAFEAWLAEDPLNNPAAEASPLRLPQYQVAALERADRLEDRRRRSISRPGRKPPSTPTRTCSPPCSSPPCCSSPGSRCGSSGNGCASAVLALGSLFLVYAIVLSRRLPIL